MKLYCEGELELDPVTESNLTDAFARDEARGDFVGIEREDGGFLQAAGERDGPYHVEYRDPTAGVLYEGSRSVFKVELLEMFLSYLRDDGSWQARVSWTPNSNFG